jgi:hypothetical protein
MALGEAREIEAGAVQAGDPSPALSGGGMDTAANGRQDRIHPRILHGNRRVR